MSETDTELGIGSIFDKITKKFDDIDKKGNQEDDMIGKSANRKLEKPWNIKIQLGVDFFNETFAFIKEMGYDVIFDITPKELILFKLDPSTTHLTYIRISKNEMSEYINTDALSSSMDNEQQENDNPKSDIVYVNFDIIDEISLNNRYALDIYFDTKIEKRMYIVNAKTIESRRLEDTSITDNPSLNEYKKNYSEKITKIMKHETTTNLTVSHNALKNVLTTLAKKQSKDKKTDGILNIKFGLSDVTFLIGNETQSTDIQMYGDDIAQRITRPINILMNLEHLVKFGKLKFANNVILHVSESIPRILETRFGAGNIKLYYIIAPRLKEEE